MAAHDPVQVARALFEAYTEGDREALLALTHEEIRTNSTALGSVNGRDMLAASFTGDVEATPHWFEEVPPEHVLVAGRIRVFRQGLRDSPAWWLMRFRDGLWIRGEAFASESAARAALLQTA